MQPEMIALRASIGHMRAADLPDLFQEHRIGQRRSTQGLLIPALATRDQVINGREGQFLMVEMAMNQLERAPSAGAAGVDWVKVR
jgi:hypothetical protein